MKLAQTLAGNWVITVTNPEEPGWETQLAEFDMSAVGRGSPAEAALETAAASALRAFAKAFPRTNMSIESHDWQAKARMRGRYAEIEIAEFEGVFSDKMAI